VRLTVDIGDDVPQVEVDVEQLRQALLALVANAGEAIFEPVGEVLIGVTRVDAAGSGCGRPLPEPLRGPAVCVEVADTGCGMDEATLARIFDPFFTTKTAGRGLGLPGLLGIMRAHGGAIAVESEPNRGTRVRLLLPLVSAPATGDRSVADEAKTRGTILVADDQGYVRDVVTAMLEREGYSVVQVEDGLEAVRHVREHPGGVTLALLDYMMPHMDGLQALREIRRLEPRMPIIVSSGFAGAEALSETGQDAPSAFLRKPYRLSDLADALQSVLGPHPTPAE